MLKILKNEQQITDAREWLRRKGLDCLSGKFSHLLRRWNLLHTVDVGDIAKSWDLLKSVQFIDGNLSPDNAILDIGAFSSELLPMLKRMKFNNLSGVDLNSDIIRMPDSKLINYRVADFYKLSSDTNNFFSAVTAISVIEHGFECDKLISSVARLLKNKGYFIASFDYWPQKIDTKNNTPFGLEWTIFSKEEIIELLSHAASYNLYPVSSLNFDACDKVIQWHNHQYTFGWLVLQKEK